MFSFFAGLIQAHLQEGHKLTAKPLEPQHWSSAHGYIKDHEITRMPFNTVVLSGTISEDAQTIECDTAVSAYCVYLTASDCSQVG